jgi:hypothetical protein
MRKYIQVTEDSDGWMTDGSCGEGWVEPPESLPSTTVDIDSSSTTTPPQFSLYHEVLGIPQPVPERKRLHSLSATSDTAAEFTPRCVLQRTIQEQKEAVHVAVSAVIDWKAMANCLSPLLQQRKPPCPNKPLDRPVCRIILPTACMCIQCAGLAAKPKIAPCLVCAALIPYSRCELTLSTRTAPPSMCFECKCTFAD